MVKEQESLITAPAKLEHSAPPNMKVVTITKIVRDTDIIGYAGTYVAHYNGKPVIMELSWIPHKLCTPLIVSA